MGSQSGSKLREPGPSSNHRISLLQVTEGTSSLFDDQSIIPGHPTITAQRRGRASNRLFPFLAVFSSTRPIWRRPQEKLSLPRQRCLRTSRPPLHRSSPKAPKGDSTKTTYLSPDLPCALKYRPPKPYRHPTLDARLTRARITSQARVRQLNVDRATIAWSPNRACRG